MLHGLLDRLLVVSHQKCVCTFGTFKGTSEFDIGFHHDSVSSARFQARKARHEENKRLFDSVVAQFGESTQRALNREKDFSTGSWLSSFPSVKNDTVLSPQEFRDRLAVRYNKPLLKLPGSCDGCGAAFSLDHGLNCTCQRWECHSST